MSPTAFITGASQGIGKATALLFAQKGYDLVITARTKDKLETVAEEIRGLGRQVIAISTDVSDRSAVEALVNLGLERFSTIDVLVNNAAIGSYDVEVSQDCNFFGTMDVCEALFPILKHDARVVHLSSNYSTFGYNLLSPELKRRFSDPNLNVEGLNFLFYS